MDYAKIADENKQAWERGYKSGLIVGLSTAVAIALLIEFYVTHIL